MFEVVHRVADEVVGVDAADLVDEEPGLLSVNLRGGAEDGGLRGGRGGRSWRYSKAWNSG
ncbi:MAG: hypothetical protein ACRDTG_16485 [Pseudonocardiaceae bacterium]